MSSREIYMTIVENSEYETASSGQETQGVGRPPQSTPEAQRVSSQPHSPFHLSQYGAQEAANQSGPSRPVTSFTQHPIQAARGVPYIGPSGHEPITLSSPSSTPPSTPTRQETNDNDQTPRPRPSSRARGKRRALGEDPIQDPLQDFLHRTEQHFLRQNAHLATVVDKIGQTTDSLERSSEVLDRIGDVLDLTTQRLLWIEQKDERRKAQNKARRADSKRGPSHESESEGSEDEADDEFDLPNPPSPPSIRRQNSPVQKSKAKKRASSDQLAQRELIRQWLKMIMGELVDPLESQVSESEAQAFAEEFQKDPLRRPCTVENFRYYLEGGPRSAWNVGASYILLDFIEQNRLHDVSLPIVRESIRKAFLARIKTLRGEYLKLAKSPERQALRNKYHRKYQRKYTLFHQRRAILEGMPALQHFLVHFDRLGIDSISSDEEDTTMEKDQLRYRVTNPTWRSAEVGQFYRKLDWCHLESRLVRDGLLGPHFGKGAPPRVREYTGETSTSKTGVRGLPYNFYDATWLEGQESGWFMGGRGLVNEIIRPSRGKVDLNFPRALEE